MLAEDYALDEEGYSPGPPVRPSTAANDTSHTHTNSNLNLTSPANLPDQSAANDDEFAAPSLAWNTVVAQEAPFDGSSPPPSPPETPPGPGGGSPSGRRKGAPSSTGIDYIQRQNTMRGISIPGQQPSSLSSRTSSSPFNETDASERLDRKQQARTQARREIQAVDKSKAAANIKAKAIERQVHVQKTREEYAATVETSHAARVERAAAASDAPGVPAAREQDVDTLTHAPAEAASPLPAQSAPRVSFATGAPGMAAAREHDVDALTHAPAEAASPLPAQSAPRVSFATPLSPSTTPFEPTPTTPQRSSEATHVEATLRRSSKGRFGISFRAPGDGTVRLDTVAFDSDVADERHLLCVGDIVESLNAILITKSLREKGLTALIHRAGDTLTVVTRRPPSKIVQADPTAELEDTQRNDPRVMREGGLRNPSLRSLRDSDPSHMSSRQHLDEGDIIGAAAAASAEYKARVRASLDADGDGKISAAEVAAGTKKAMLASAKCLSKSASSVKSKTIDALDADGDGQISAAELAAGAAQGIRRAKTGLVDMNKKLSKSAKALRDSLDTDGDGNVSAAEFAAGMRAMRIAMVKRIAHKMSLATVWMANIAAVVALCVVGFGAALVLTPNELWLALISWGFAVLWGAFVVEPLWIMFWVTLTEIVRWLLSLGFDTDGDGTISFAELRAGTRKVAVENLDADGDGKLSASEIAAGAGRAFSRTSKSLLGAAGKGVTSAATGLTRAASRQSLPVRRSSRSSCSSETTERRESNPRF